MSVTNYQPMPLNIPEERRTQLHHSGNLTSRMVIDIAELLPQNPGHFSWQPSARVAQILTVLLSQSYDFSYYVRRWYWHLHRPYCRYPLLRGHMTSQWHQRWLANVTCAWSWRRCGNNATIHIEGIFTEGVARTWVDSVSREYWQLGSCVWDAWLNWCASG